MFAGTTRAPCEVGFLPNKLVNMIFLRKGPVA
jgi:hypothetical protein